MNEKDDNEFSLEHIIPEALGGKILNNELFRTRKVCRRCNNIAGLFIDAPFLKNFFTENDKARATWTKDPNLPIYPSFLGSISDCSINDMKCDFWTFPKGSRVYHFYAKEEKYIAYVGGNPIERTNGNSIAVLVLSELLKDNQQEIERTIKSFSIFFPKERKYAYNFKLPEENFGIHEFDNTTREYKSYIDSIIKSKHHIKLVFDINQSNRFFCKLAIAIGYNILGDDFINSDYANELRNGLWGKENLVHGKTSLSFNGSIDDRLYKIGNANAITILKSNERLIYALSLFGKTSIILICSDSKILDKIPEKYKEGISFAWFPPLKLATKELSFIDFIRRNDNNLKNIGSYFDKQKIT